MAQQVSSDVAYTKENEIIARYRALAEQKDITPEQVSLALNEVCNQYERLLDDSKLLTSVGDRLQRKLKSANQMLREQSEEIKRINNSLNEKNTELQLTIDELTRAKASRRATTLLFILTIALFIISELIEQYIESSTSQLAHGWMYTWGLKLILVVSLKPLEGLLERYTLKNALRAQERERAAQAEGQAHAANGAPVAAKA
jgi:hypothetical protein